MNQNITTETSVTSTKQDAKTSSTVKVRPAKRADLTAIMELGKLLHAESRYRTLSFSPTKVSDTFNTLLKGAGCVFVAELKGKIVGGIAGWLSPTWYGVEQSLMEVALFITPEHRHGAVAESLIMAFVSFGKRQGCTLIQSGVVSGVEQEKTEALYQRLGGQKHGSLYEFGGI